LLERCEPGTPLESLDDDEVTEIGTSLLRRLWRVVAAPELFPMLGDVTARWAELVRARFDRYRPPFDHGLVEHGAALLEALPTTASRDVLLHVDFHPGNVLAAHREPWLTIDPKPMLGDPAFDVAQLLRHGDPRGRALEQRLAVLAVRLDLPAERVAAWAVARNVEWAMWDLAHDAFERAKANMARAAELARG
jgi:streptomycin 6-kinase